MNVCDGAGIPTLIITDRELCLNRFFDENLNGWATILGASMTRYNEVSTFGSYVMNLSDTSVINRSSVYYQAAISTGFSQNVIAGAWIKGVQSESWRGLLEFWDSTNHLGWKYFDYTDEWEFYSILIRQVDINNGLLHFRLYPTALANEQATIRMTGATMKVATEIIELEHPENKEPGIVKSLRYSTKVDKFNAIDFNVKGYRLSEQLTYPFIERDILEKIMDAEEAKRLIYYPHLDADTFHVARIHTRQSQQYLNDKYLGHKLELMVNSLDTQNNLSIRGSW